MSEELGRDAGALGGGDAEAGPRGIRGGADLVKEAGTGAGCGEHPKAGAIPGGGEGTRERKEDEGGFVDDDEGGGGALAARECADARAIDMEVVLAAGDAARAESEGAEEVKDLKDDLAGVDFGGGEDDDFGLVLGDEAVGGAGGGHEGFAGLAAAVDGGAMGCEELALL